MSEQAKHKSADQDNLASYAPYAVMLSPTAENALVAVTSKSDLTQIDHLLCALETVPGIGRVYDPLYEAARPTKDVLVVYAGNYEIYYVITEEEKLVQVLYLEDQRRNPLTRFKR